MLQLIEKMLRSEYYPKVPQAISMGVFAAILFYSFAGNPHGETNLAVALTWTIWWMLLPFSAVFFGRLWCSFCPISTFARLAGRLRRKPRRNHSSSLPGGGMLAGGAVLLVLTWAMIAWRIDEMPLGTGALLLVFTAGALVLELLFGERAWCKSICPIGAIIGLYSRLAPFQIRPREKSCSTKCGRASACHAALASDQCLVDGPVSSLRSNRDCNFCGDCLKSCRHSSLELRFGWPEALSARAPAMKRSEAAILMLLFSLVLLDLVRMTPLYPQLMKRLLSVLPALDYNTVLALVLLALAACLLAIYSWTAWVSSIIARRGLGESFAVLASPYVAIAAAIHLSSELFHMVTHGTRPLLAMAVDLGLAVEFPAVVRGAIYVQDSTLQALDVALLLVATVLAVRAFWRMSRYAGLRGLRLSLSSALPGVLSVLIAAAAIFLFTSPLGLIH